MTATAADPATLPRADARRWWPPRALADRLRDPAYRLLLAAFARERRLLIVVVMLTTVSALLEGITFGLLALTLDVLVGQGDAVLSAAPAWLAQRLAETSRDHLFLGLVLLAVLAQATRAAVSVLATALNTLFSARVQRHVQQALYRDILALSFACASRFPVGELTNYVVTPASKTGYLLANALSTLATLLNILAYVVILCSLSVPLFLAALALFGTLAWVQKRMLRRVHHFAARLGAATAALSRRLVETLQALRLVHVQHAQGLVLDRIAHSQEAVIDATAGLSRRMALVTPVSDSLLTIGIGLFLVVSYYVFKSGRTDFLPQMITFMAVLNRLSGRLSNLAGTGAEMLATLGQFQVVNAVLAAPDRAYLRSGGGPCPPAVDLIEFQDVTLTYPGRDRPALVGVSFRIPKGSVTALVGPSGSGKSSLADLLVGLYEPTSGRILLDGCDLAATDLASWRASLGVVSQDAILFNDTIRENIRFGRPDADDDEVAAAACAAHADEFIRAIPTGYDTLVGERGFALSGGQRQRLALARALLRRPGLLILDEATSALDSHSERAIQDTLRDLRHTCTQLVIAHRLATVRDADCILVLQEGRLVDQGTHDELLARGGLYAQLWDSQARSPHAAS